MSGKMLTKHKDKITFLPVYMDLFSDDIQEQIYTSVVICEYGNNLGSLVPT